MRILIDICHPSRVHLYKYFISEMEKRGHNILVTASDKEVTKYLLNFYDINNIIIDGYNSNIIKKIISYIISEYKLLHITKKYNPDIIIGSIRAAHVGFLLRIPTINFDDDEYGFYLGYPFYNTIIGFSGYKKRKKNIHIINGYKELAYLSEEYYQPNESFKEEIGLSKDEKYVLLRFVAMDAYHDIGKKGFTLEEKILLIQKISKYSKAFISSEKKLPKELSKYKINISPEKMHDALFHANLLVTDSQTMTTEAAILGTPAIRCNSFVGNNDMGNFIDLENKYKLIYNFEDKNEAINKAIELIQDPNLEFEWNNKKEYMINDKINVTKFMIWFIENYPSSVKNINNYYTSV